MISRDDAKAVYIGANALVGVGAAFTAMGEADSAAVSAGVAVVLAGLIGSVIAFQALGKTGALDPAPERDARRTRQTIGLALAVAAFVPAVLGAGLPAARLIDVAAAAVRLAAPFVHALS
ncbi:hypothetical protein [Caulobacter sp. 17J80-11]|uniref:hypothetical protein n=1 Tax=Caulobacter sp. 17J80-11 TaxID=2763502 RepID=UPI001653D061|nr:hypothetical protein [Caulobacter sp. 17J80-11]MBC6981248.1 hypothetical protein [Caulobacter sp. 17J80-11]